MIDENKALYEAELMMSVPQKDLPELAMKYFRYMANKIGACGEVYLTAFCHYNQAVLKMPCADESYKITVDGKNWFKNNKP